MAQKRRGLRVSTRPVAVGTGLIALDAVVSAEENVPVRHWAGGTCGNVLIALRYLGWTAKPIARLSTGKITTLLLDDLSCWGVSQTFVRTEPDGSTPVIVQRITKDAAGNPKHSFHWRCDGCGSHYPGYKPELLTVAETIAPNISKAKVFFFDRVSAGALHLARAAKEAGALVFFEPCSVGNPLLFRQAWEVSHVVKYSHERLSDFPEVDVTTSPRLVIETLGHAGLRYLRRTADNRDAGWTELKALPVSDLKDAAGAGDWCTAGIISKLGASGFAGFSKASAKELVAGMRFGQALASWNCRFEGARGGMYAVSKTQFRNQVTKILSGTPQLLPMDRTLRPQQKISNALCSICERTDGGRVSVKQRKAR